MLTGSIPKSLPRMYNIIMKRPRAGARARARARWHPSVDARASSCSSPESKPFLIKPNNHEVGRIFNARPETPEECIPFAKELHEKGAQNVIVSCGGHGSLLYDEKGEIHTVPTAKIKLVNATGAGDSMVAGFVAKVQEGADYETALRFASACGTATAASRASPSVRPSTACTRTSSRSSRSRASNCRDSRHGIGRGFQGGNPRFAIAPWASVGVFYYGRSTCTKALTLQTGTASVWRRLP